MRFFHINFIVRSIELFKQCGAVKYAEIIFYSKLNKNALTK